MTPNEAATIAAKILARFTGPPADAWEETLATLDAGRAGTALARITRSHEHRWLSIAQFLAIYNGLHMDDASTKPKCGWCDGTGWLETLQHVARGQVYSGVEPCTRCNEGRAREVSECWTKSPDRQFVSDAEAERLVAANRGAAPPAEQETP